MSLEKEATEVIDCRIKFLKDIKKQIKGADIKSKNLALFTAATLDAYMEKQLMHDVIKSINSYNEKQK